MLTGNEIITLLENKQEQLHELKQDVKTLQIEVDLLENICLNTLPL